MKNYYEILEISESASQEVIERVYKLFAKKYHPDVNPDNPKEAEEKFKIITEAYEVLSNEAKRREYDNQLRNERAAKASAIVSGDYSGYTQPIESGANQESLRRMQEQLLARQREIEKQRIENENKLRREYNDAYISALERAGIHVVYKKSWKEILNTIKGAFFTLIVLILICIAVWLIPSTHNKIIEIYDNSGPVKSLIEAFGK